LGIHVALAAVAQGAAVLEKHFTLNRSLPGPDHQASLDFEGLAALVRGVREVEAALGDGRKIPVPAERNTAAVARRSLCAAQDLPAGTLLTRDMVVARRPGTGLPPSRLDTVVGRRLLRSVAAEELLAMSMFAPNVNHELG
jgi:sialic acid synthase SpsE